jgi:hypothetical protein
LRVRSASERVEASALSTRVCRALSHPSNSSALPGKTALRPRQIGLCLRRVRLGEGLISQLAPEVSPLTLQRGHLIRQLAALAVGGRLFPDGVSMLRPKSLDFGRHNCR